MISGPFTLFVLWTIAFPFCTAQLYKHLFARSPGRFCHSHLPDGWPNITWPFDLESLDQYNGTTIAENSPQVRRIRGLIRNQAALYPLIVDSKNFLFLKSVFTQDVTVNMSMSRPIVNGLPALQDALRDAFDGLQTHHQLGTPFVFAEYRHCLAETLTYFTATISGTGESSAKVCCRSNFAIVIIRVGVSGVLMVGFERRNRQ